MDCLRDFAGKTVLNGNIRLFRLTQLPVIKTNSADPDQTASSAASDLGLHFLPMSRMSQSMFYR